MRSKKFVFICGSADALVRFRLDFIKDLIGNGYEVIALFPEGRKEFIDILDIKSQFVSANVNVKGFGISDLQKSLLSARRSGNKNIDSNSILLNNNTVSNFSEIKGSLDIGSSRAINKLIANASNVGINSVTSGSIDLSKKSFEGVTNAIFITGTTDNQIPLNIAIGHRGPFSNLQNSANLSQVEQYLDSL